MGDTRVDGNASRYVGPTDGGCDDENLTCGDDMSRVRADEQAPHVELPDPKPVAVATVAANLNEAKLRAE